MPTYRLPSGERVTTAQRGELTEFTTFNEEREVISTVYLPKVKTANIVATLQRIAGVR